MRTYLDCIPCFIRQTLDSVRMTTDDVQIHEKVLRETLNLAYQMDMSQSPPAMAQKIHRFIREITGIKDPYLALKDHYNKLAMQRYPELRERIETSSEPLETAVRLAIAGNIIDFGVNSEVQDNTVEKTIAESLVDDLDMDAFQRFRHAIISADDILYLGDNAGEIVFDRLLIEQIPYAKVTFVVKGSPILNDATIEDAEIVGLTDIVDVIDNGSDAPGTILEDCSAEFRQRFYESDLLIAKGQGNFETLCDINKESFFLLQPKCAVLARHLGCEIGRLVLYRKETKTGVCIEEQLEERN
ncbi:MAG: DUF89 domain-containing protein [Phycisphaerae bacterium]